jgi:predicted aldo/keto reductase-like oxidoreductase
MIHFDLQSLFCPLRDKYYINNNERYNSSILSEQITFAFPIYEPSFTVDQCPTLKCFDYGSCKENCPVHTTVPQVGVKYNNSSPE